VWSRYGLGHGTNECAKTNFYKACLINVFLRRFDLLDSLHDLVSQNFVNYFLGKMDHLAKLGIVLEQQTQILQSSVLSDMNFMNLR